MKKFFALSAAAVFFCMFSVMGQESPEQGMIEPGTENNNAESAKSADELFPYIPRLRTNIAKEDYKVSLERAEKIIQKMEKALLPGKTEREKIVAEAVKGLEERYRSKDKGITEQAGMRRIRNMRQTATGTRPNRRTAQTPHRGPVLQPPSHSSIAGAGILN